MSYPMTWKRVLNRNHLEAGDYNDVPAHWALRVNVRDPGLGTLEQLREGVWPHLVKRSEDYERQAALLLGDLRRLERDVRDESEVCRVIADRTGIDRDVVAGVLKEFFDV